MSGFAKPFVEELGNKNRIVGGVHNLMQNKYCIRWVCFYLKKQAWFNFIYYLYRSLIYKLEKLHDCNYRHNKLSRY